MTYLIKKTDGSFLLELDNNQINTESVSLTLFGRDTKNYGQLTNQNFVYLVDRFSNSEAPANPLSGQIWYDRANRLVKVFNGSSWDFAFSPFDGVSGIIKITINFYNSPAIVLAAVSQNRIIAVYSYYEINNNLLPETVTAFDNVFEFRTLFPNGLVAGITLAYYSNVSLEFYGHTVGTDSLRVAKNISLVGDFTGTVSFDGSSNVNISTSFNTVNIGNNSVAGTYTSVTVDDTGKIKSAGNITYTDVIAALGYTPFSSSNVSFNSAPNTVVVRNSKGDIAANLIFATTTNANSFSSNVSIQLQGDITGASQRFNGTSNVIIDSYRSMPGNVTAGVYNSVTVNNKGIVESAVLTEILPVGSIILYNNSVVIPEGWALCNGGNVVTPTGATVTTPDLTSQGIGGTVYIMKAFKNIFLPSNDTVVGTVSVNLQGGGAPVITFAGGPDIQYPPLVFSNVNVASVTSTFSNIYTVVKSVKIPSGFKGSSETPNSAVFNGSDYEIDDVLYFNFPNFNDKASVKVKEITSNGGVSKIELLTSGKYKPFLPNSLGADSTSLTSVVPTGGSGKDAVFNLEIERINQPTPIQDVDLEDNLFFDAVSYIMSAGDSNAVMLSQTDIFGDLSNLTVLQVINNLNARRRSGLPPRLGKYMLSLTDIVNYSGVLGIPVDTTLFTPAVQNRIMLTKITDVSNELAYLGFFPSDDKLFGAIYIGLAQYIAVLNSSRTITVGRALLNAGLEATGFDTIDRLSTQQFLEYCSKVIVNSKVVIYNNRVSRNSAIEVNNALGFNLIDVPVQLVLPPFRPTGNSNVTVSQTIIDGVPVVFGGSITTANANVTQGGGSLVIDNVPSSRPSNNRVFTTVNGIRYGYYGEPSSGNLSLSTGTGTAIPGGGIDITTTVEGGVIDLPSISIVGGYYSALVGQESFGGNYNVFNNRGNRAPYGDLSIRTIAEVYELQRRNLSEGGVSSAVGAFQFVRTTLQEIVNSPEARAAGITESTLFTPEIQNKIVEIFTAKNARALESQGITATDAAVGASHLLGIGGGPALFAAYQRNPNASLYDIFGSDVVNNNPVLGTTAASAVAYFTRRYGTGQTWRVGVVNAAAVLAPIEVTTLPSTTPASAGGATLYTTGGEGTDFVIGSSGIDQLATLQDLANDLNAVATRIINATKPLASLSQIVAVAVPESIEQVFRTASTIAENAQTIATSAGRTVISSVSNLLNNILENSGRQPPVVQSPNTTSSPVVTNTGSSSNNGNGFYTNVPPRRPPSTTGLTFGTTAPVTPAPSVVATAPIGTPSGTQLSFGPSIPSRPASTPTGSYSSGATLSFGTSIATRPPGSSATYSLGTTVPRPTSGGTASNNYTTPFVGPQ